ncbi:S1C family serine protease [Bacillus alkalicellulosilyticus]|uniref:S1C family serine protease n=1 Tax=Alkalihalobacterium alkalicellulosilyticum TaxID=1912214 RepID=UPI0009961305|nr:trypsin-like peptidase domain-containing protein [Bacillus alkalicellulosilyticus]
MGYYDDHFPKREEQQKKRGNAGLSAFAGAIIGGVLVVTAIPALSQIGWLPYQVVTNSQEEAEPVFDMQEAPVTTDTVNLSVSTEITTAVEKVSDAVVGVINLQGSSLFSDVAGEGTGSGVIYKKADGKAFVVTNHHVIDGARQIEVSLVDGTRVPAELLGSDMLTDLAVLEIDAEDINTIAEFGSSETLRVGEPAIAIGNPLGLAFSSTVTQGIISATERSIPVDVTGDRQIDWHAEVLQTDAAINPGNSGGALINVHGQVIGINSMKIAQSSVEGIGFAIPTAIAVPVINDLERFGEVRRPQMGIGIRSLSEVPGYHWQDTLKLPEDVKAGVVITSIGPMSPAARAGLEEYDVIVQINGNDIEDGHDLRKYLYTETNIGDEIQVTVYRNGEKHTASVVLAEQQSF